MKDLTTKDVAEELGCSEVTVRRIIKRGELSAYRRKGGNLKRKRYFVRRSDLTTYKNGRVYTNDVNYREKIAASISEAYCHA